jgi:DNA repair protein RadD
MRLRNYQDFATDSFFSYFGNGGTGNPIAALPTGTGKSLIIADFCRRALTSYPKTRILKLTHVKELIVQNFDKLLSLWPTAPAGIYSAGLGQKEIRQITFAGIASVSKRAKEFGHIDIVIIDECHLVSPNDNTMYRKLINDLMKQNPFLKVIGLTATKYRLGHGELIEEGGLFTDVCCDLTTYENFNWFIDEGYLSTLIPRATRFELDVSKVRLSGGEFVALELQKAVDKEEITRAALYEALQYSQGRNHWLVFASGIDHAEHVANTLNYMGVSASWVTSNLSKAERDERISAFRSGKIVALVNNGILTTGFDYADIDFIVVLRPTQSPGLWVQMLGRGTRPKYAEGFDLSTTEGRLGAIASGPKPNCLVMDFAGNTRRLGPINDPVLPRKKGKGKGTAPVKICENCGVYCHTSVRVCKACGWEFPLQIKFKGTSATDALIKKKSDNPIIQDFPVDRVIYEEHKREGKAPSLKVTYHCGLRVFKEWWCLEHQGLVKHKARDYWRIAATIKTPPETVAEALSRINELKAPTSIKIWINTPNGYPEVRDHVYAR